MRDHQTLEAESPVHVRVQELLHSLERLPYLPAPSIKLDLLLLNVADHGLDLVQIHFAWFPHFRRVKVVEFFEPHRHELLLLYRLGIE